MPTIALTSASSGQTLVSRPLQGKSLATLLPLTRKPLACSSGGFGCGNEDKTYCPAGSDYYC
jgi:hypothetical protein